VTTVNHLIEVPASIRTSKLSPRLQLVTWLSSNKTLAACHRQVMTHSSIICQQENTNTVMANLEMFRSFFIGRFLGIEVYSQAFIM